MCRQASWVKMFLVRCKLGMGMGMARRKATRMARMTRTHASKTSNLPRLHNQGETIIAIHGTWKRIVKTGEGETKATPSSEVWAPTPGYNL